MRKTFWEFSKGRILWYYLGIGAVAYFSGMLEPVGDLAVFWGGIAGIAIAPLIVLVIQWLFQGNKKSPNK